MIEFIKSIFNRRKKQEDLNKLILKYMTDAYDRGYKAGANQQNNCPCVCGFWGDKK